MDSVRFRANGLLPILTWSQWSKGQKFQNARGPQAQNRSQNHRFGPYFQNARGPQEVNTGFGSGFGESGFTEGWGDLKDSQKLSKHRKI